MIRLEDWSRVEAARGLKPLKRANVIVFTQQEKKAASTLETDHNDVTMRGIWPTSAPAGGPVYKYWLLMRMMVGTITPKVVFTPALLSLPRRSQGGDRRAGVNTTKGVVVPTIIRLQSSPYLFYIPQPFYWFMIRSRCRSRSSSKK